VNKAEDRVNRAWCRTDCQLVIDDSDVYRDLIVIIRKVIIDPLGIINDEAIPVILINRIAHH
jgi:hypothetical protein